MQYHRPTTLAEALRLAAEPGARVLAGGTDLVLRMRDGRERPDALVSLGRVAELAGVTFGADRVRLGARTTLAELVEHEELGRLFPALLGAARVFGSMLVRNLATVGGNLCNASPCSDLAPPLIALGARVELASREARRELPLGDFFVGPRETRLAPGELLTAVVLDRPGPRDRSAVLKHTRVTVDLALVNVAVALELDRGKVARVRAVAGAVGPTPLRLLGVEALVAGQALAPELLAEAGRRAGAEVKPISDVRASAEYRRMLTGVLCRRALAAAAEVS
ncbi:MAG: xanthine dehydrogenase family protein subunit M [Polyangiaceae bacterium]|nr:xanthine dehydrogenase family protein subunit M [Polyangiaceae bacterium]